MRTILLVDDDPELREALGRFLEEAGYSIIQAENGQEALELLDRGPRPALILLDFRMPVMDGAAFRAEQRSRPELATIPVILISGESKLSDVARRLGVEAYAPKSIDGHALLRLIAHYLPLTTTGPDRRGCEP